MYSYVKKRKRMLRINEIKNDQNIVIRDSQEIGDEAVRVFENQFAETENDRDYSMLQCLLKIIIEEQIEEMDRDLIVQEVKKAGVFFK